MPSAPVRITIPPPTPWQARGLAIALLAAGFTVELLMPVNLIISVIFPVAIGVCKWTRSTRFLWGVTAASIALTLGVLIVGQHPIDGTTTMVYANRILSSLGIVIVAILIHLIMRYDLHIESQQQELEARNSELEAINHELGTREEELVRANEELQSSSEELERQSEELRVTNEELVTWEKMLEQLLELSRSLTVDLKRDDMFARICETLGLLSDGKPAAILLKRDDKLSVACHYGFGPRGVQENELPLGQSFAALVMSLGQTGYLEDARLRADLRIPQPAQGELLQSVLSTPLRVQSKSIGTIEVYSHEPKVWSDAAVAMVESLAAQASISLYGAELIEAIQQERRRFEAAFRTVPFGMAVADDPRGDSVRLNPAAAALFGVPPDENVSASTPAGIRLVRCFRRGDEPLPSEQLPLARALRGEELHNVDYEVTTPRGDSFTLLGSSAPIFDRQGAIQGAVLAFADVTPQRRLLRELDLRRREAEEASLRKTRFLAAVSHDIRTPANAISLMAELIRRDAGNPGMAADIAHTAERLQANTFALMELVGDVLDVARFDSGKVELVESQFSLGEMLEQECQHVLPLAREKGISLECRPPRQPIWVRTDRVKLGRILGNLLGNAIKFTERGQVSVVACIVDGPERKLEIEVRDTGIGIAPEHLAWIFDEFAQLHNPARDRMKGTGLGLAICRRLIDVLGGTIRVDSKLGSGSAFTVTLPSSLLSMRLDGVAPNAAAAGARQGNQPSSRFKDLRILLVEDHSTTREGTARILTDEGATVVQAVDGKSALMELGRCGADVLLLDMMLPDLDGREVLKAIGKSRPASLRGVIVMTGDLTQERVEEVKRLGADALLEKPVDLQKLLASIRAIVS